MSNKGTKSGVKLPCRALKLSTLEELEQELVRIERAHAAGTLSACGNWSPGKILGHISSWIDFGFEGYPMSPPPFVRAVCRLMKGVFLRNQAMKPGFRIHGAPEGTYGLEEMDVPTGLARLRRSIKRLNFDELKPHPLFGLMTREQWIRMHVNHASLHLGFLKLS